MPTRIIQVFEVVSVLSAHTETLAQEANLPVRVDIPLHCHANLGTKHAIFDNPVSYRGQVRKQWYCATCTSEGR